METTVEFTPTMLVMIAVLAGLLQGFKAAIWATKVKPFMPLISLAIGIAGAYFTQQPNSIVTGIVIGGAASFGFDIFKGIGPKVLLICLIMLISVGCLPVQDRPIQMTPVLEVQVSLAATTTDILNTRCQDGDEDACKKGLSLANETLQLIIAGLDGEIEDQP